MGRIYRSILKILLSCPKVKNGVRVLFFLYNLVFTIACTLSGGSMIGGTPARKVVDAMTSRMKGSMRAGAFSLAKSSKSIFASPKTIEKIPTMEHFILKEPPVSLTSQVIS
jgi:hypothetical protein